MVSPASQNFGRKPLVLQTPVSSEPAAQPYRALLAEIPVAMSFSSDPADGETPYPGWERDHALHRRFYLTGMQWVFSSTRFSDAKALLPYTQAAIAGAAAERSPWRSFPDPKQHWQALSYNQLRAVRNGEAVFFHKAALVLEVLYLALSDGDPAQQDNLLAELRRRVRVLPAIYRLDGLDADYLNAVLALRPGLSDRIAAAASQPPAVIQQLANGFTVTRNTAHAIRAALVQAVRAKRLAPPSHGGFRVTGYPEPDSRPRSASPHELIQLG